MGGAPGMTSRLPIRGGVEEVIKSVVTGSLRCPSLRTEQCQIHGTLKRTQENALALAISLSIGASFGDCSSNSTLPVGTLHNKDELILLDVHRSTHQQA